MQKLKQYSLVLACVISLFASSFAACVCLHHQEHAKTEASACHDHSEEGETTSQQINQADTGNESVTRMFSENECRCFQPVTLKTGAKSETVKLNLQLAELPEKAIQATIVSAPQEISVKNTFAKPLYLSDSFYNLAPGRAPPGL